MKFDINGKQRVEAYQGTFDIFCAEDMLSIHKVLNRRTGNMIGHTYHGDVIGGMANAAAVDVYIQRRCMI